MPVQPQAPIPATPPKTSAMAITSLVLGCCAIPFLFVCLLGLPLAIAAIVFGYLAKGEIRRSSNSLTGDGMALTGLILGYVTIGLCIVLIVAVTVPNFIHAREVARKQSCINNLRQIDSAKQQWATANCKLNDDVATWSDLLAPDKNYLKASPVCKAGGTYTIGTVTGSPTCSVAGHSLP